MIEFTFEDAPWETALRGRQTVDGVTLLSLLEPEDGKTADEVFRFLEREHITLTVEGLPQDMGSGDTAVRLRREKELAKGDLLAALEETDPLRLYLEELARLPAAGDEVLLAMELAQGNSDAAERLTNLSLYRCVELAKEYTGYGVLLLDLIQEAGLGLWQGIAAYTGGDFAAHRDWWIRQYLAKAVVLQAKSGGVGQKLRTGMEDYRDVDQRLLAELGRNPTLEEIAEAMHVTAEETAAYADMVASARARRQIERQRETPEPTLEEEQAVEDTAYFQSRQRIQDMLSVLTEAEAKLLILRFGLEGGLPMSPEETGRQLGLTPQQVVELEATALSKLRQAGE